MEQKEQLAPKYILTEIIEQKLAAIDEVTKELAALRQDVADRLAEVNEILRELSKGFTEAQLREYRVRKAMKDALYGE